MGRRKMHEKDEPERRHFLLKMVNALGYGAFGAIAWSAYLSQAQANKLVLRPPGALKEKDFVSTCIRCGMCVEACPYDVLELATISDQISIGTPYFTPRVQACQMCPDIPCASICPSKSLDLDLLRVDDELSIDNARMGLATINTETCLAHLGLQCTMCIRACPLADQAIVLTNERNPRTDMHAFLLPVVIADYCTGCGMCERACPTEIASIHVLPLSISTGDVGSHYIVGWEEEDEKRISQRTGDVILDRTKRNQKSAVDNVNDVDGILKGLYDD